MPLTAVVVRAWATSLDLPANQTDGNLTLSLEILIISLEFAPPAYWSKVFGSEESRETTALLLGSKNIDTGAQCASNVLETMAVDPFRVPKAAKASSVRSPVRFLYQSSQSRLRPGYDIHQFFH